jgi:hypothetical protein
LKPYKIFLVCLIYFSSFVSLYCSGDILKRITPDKNTQYIIRLNNGDIVSGYIIEMVNDPAEGEGIKVQTVIGNAIIFANQIVDIDAKDDNYRHSHSVYLLPTAMPVGNNYFVGIYELLFLYAGGGIGDWLSITAGHSFLPAISSTQQISTIDVKFSLVSLQFEDVARKLTLALGGNMAFVNNNNRFVHLYGVGTVELSRTMLTTVVFVKTGSQDIYNLYFGNNLVNLIYEDGSFGIGLGLDTKIIERHDLHLIGELWNSNVAKPSNTAILLGFRICNTSFSADFGLSFFTIPYAAPFVSFKWTPF